MNSNYFRLVAAAFAWGSSTSQLAILAVVLAHHGIGTAGIGTAKGTSFMVMAAGMLAAGPLAQRYGARRTMIGAALVGCMTLAVLPFAVFAVWSVTLVLGVGGLAIGLFSPAGQAFAQASAAEHDRTRAVGMFAAMILIPVFYGPAIGEWSLSALGEPGYFTIAALPLVIALALLCSLRDNEAAVTGTTGYLALLRDRRQWLPNLATMQSGIGYGFAFSLLPLLLAERHIAVAVFFTPFAIVLAAVRFIGMRFLQRLAPALVAGAGVVAYAAGSASLLSPSWVVVGIAGVLFGSGYGVLLPVCVIWAIGFVAPAQRSRAVALVNTSFSCGAVIAAQGAGVLLPAIGWNGVLLSLAGFVIIVGAAIGFAQPGGPSGITKKDAAGPGVLSPSPPAGVPSRVR